MFLLQFVCYKSSWAHGSSFVLTEDANVPEYLRKWAETRPGTRFTYAFDRTPRLSAAKKEMHQQALNELDLLSRQDPNQDTRTRLPATLPVCKCITIVQFSKTKLGESEDDLISVVNDME